MTDVIMEWEARAGRRLRLRELYILDAVVKWGSMAKAAAPLVMSQPAISQAIANLEATLHVRLLDRSATGVQPTPYAELLLKRGHVVFDELRQSVKDIASLADPTSGELRVGSPESFMAGLIPAIIDRMRHRHPKIIVKVEFAEGANPEFRELRDRRVDLLFGRISDSFSDDEIEAQVLFQEQYRVVASTRSKWARQRKIALADLVGEQWIHMPPDIELTSSIGAVFQSHGLPNPPQAVASMSMHLRFHLLATGRYLTVMPISSLRFNARPWGLRALPVDLPIHNRQVAILSLKNRMLSPVATLFLQHARAIGGSIAESAATPHLDLARARHRAF
jgi:DNA-binding transcriptional LysR family regulator